MKNRLAGPETGIGCTKDTGWSRDTHGTHGTHGHTNHTDEPHHHPSDPHNHPDRDPQTSNRHTPRGTHARPRDVDVPGADPEPAREPTETRGRNLCIQISSCLNTQRLPLRLPPEDRHMVTQVKIAGQ